MAKIAITYKAVITREIEDDVVEGLSFEDAATETDAMFRSYMQDLSYAFGQDANKQVGRFSVTLLERKGVREVTDERAGGTREKDPMVPHPVSGQSMRRSELIRSLAEDGVRPSRIVKILRSVDIPCSQKDAFSICEQVNSNVSSVPMLQDDDEAETDSASTAVNEVIKSRRRGPGGKFVKATEGETEAV